MLSKRGLVLRMFLAIMIVSGAPASTVASASSGPSRSATPKPVGLASAESDRAVPAAVGDRIQRSTARSRDLTGDGWPDVLARQPDVHSGALWAYTHSGSAQGNVFSAKTLVGTNWNTMNWVGVAELTGDTPEYETTAEQPADLLARRNDGALLVYPHSGTFNGTRTWLDPVVVGTNWNIYEKLMVGDVDTDGFDDILGVDNADGRAYVYLHSGSFNGKSTFRPRQYLFDGHADINEWDFFVEWSREDPDLAGFNLLKGDMLATRHTHKLNGPDTWDHSNPWTFAAGQFAAATTHRVFLMDVNGDGRNDVVKSTPSGALLYYPFRGWGASPALGTPVQIGNGWLIMDLIT
ncbi:hypothetical protein [Saccharothrix luteola]|uniref:hypothetical protein n=1 Tax=Saccharothrix luteola TaxID=2893018 RepID=UPI001E5DA9D4|nr:hypothetical protein [Saccharothrix luteola]MCC8242765.1 hypothetical protein [Saccharothrix luteola]